MRNWLKLIISSVAAISLLAVTSSSYGVAAFARQTGLECVSCHAAPGFPSLNSFGAAFKAGGYTQGDSNPVTGDALNLPGALNLGVVFKARVKMKLVDGQSHTDMEIPDETAVFAAGRVSDDIGFVIELGDAWFNSFKLVFAPEVGPVRIGVVPWLTDAFGAGWLFETLSTGAVRNIRIIEDRGLVSAQSATGWGGGGESAGVGIYVWHPMGFVAFTPFSAIHLEDVQSLAYYARAAVTPSLDFADLAIGVAYKFGTEEGTLPDTETVSVANLVTGAVTTVTADVDADHKVVYNWLAVDAQMMMADIPLTAVVTYANDLEAELSYLTVGVDYLILDNLGVTVAYRAALDTNGTSQVGGSIKYGVSQNVRLSVDVHHDLGDADGNGAYTQILPMVSGSW